MSEIPQRPNDDSGLINWATALEIADGDEGLLDELVAVFLDEAPAAMAQVLRSIEEADAVVLRRSAHTVKGSLRIFECPTAIEYAWQIEQIGRIPEQEERDLTAADLTRAKEVWDLLNEQLSRILPAMEERIKKR